METWAIRTAIWEDFSKKLEGKGKQLIENSCDVSVKGCFTLIDADVEFLMDIEVINNRYSHLKAQGESVLQNIFCCATEGTTPNEEALRLEKNVWDLRY